MPPRPFVNDALWRCLCPRYSQTPAPASFATAAKRFTSSTELPRRTASKPAKICQLRSYNTSSNASEESLSSLNQYQNSFPVATDRPFGRRRRPKEKVSLVHLPNNELYERLRTEGAAGHYEDALNIIKILIKDRGERPNVRMYTAVLHSFADCQEGTAGKMRRVLEEMESTGVELDGRGAQCVLEALAVHPDYMLRTDILEYMKGRWFDVSNRTHSFVIAGMLRDRLFEQALDKLEDMVRQRAHVEPWLWDKAIWILLEYGEVEEAFYVLSMKQGVEENGAKLSNSLWLRLLDDAGKRQLSEATAMIWNTQVIPGYIKPPTGTCLNVLCVAARSGAVSLATDVFRVLAERNTQFEVHHYETLIECYLAADDLSAALSVVLIMQDAGLKISTEALHPLFTYLRKDVSKPMEAFTLLQQLEGEGKRVPTAAVNVCMQASIGLNQLAEAIEIYKALHAVSRTGPNASTFNILFQGCHRAGRKELAMFLANEMIELGIKPDRLTYDRLILVCVNSGDLNDAFLYYEEMTSQGLMPRRGTFEDLIRRAVEADDPRAVALLREYKEKGGFPESRVIFFEKKVMDRFEEKGATVDVESSVIATDAEDATSELESASGAETTSKEEEPEPVKNQSDAQRRDDRILPH